jgi:hypothetical protein
MEGFGNGETTVHTGNKTETSGSGRPLEFDDQRITKKARVESEEDKIYPTHTQGESYSMTNPNALPGLKDGNGK